MRAMPKFADGASARGQCPAAGGDFFRHRGRDRRGRRAILTRPDHLDRLPDGGTFMLVRSSGVSDRRERSIAGPLVGGLLLGMAENVLLLIPGVAGGLLKASVPMLALLIMLIFRPEDCSGARPAHERAEHIARARSASGLRAIPMATSGTPLALRARANRAFYVSLGIYALFAIIALAPGCCTVTSWSARIFFIL